MSGRSSRRRNRTHTASNRRQGRLAHLKLEISEKKWAEARHWAAGRVTKKKYKMPREQQPDKTVAGSAKRLASRFYQLKAGHCLRGQYLDWSKNQPTAKC
jgi:O-methyltransferase involved in polyketide biosynthesis